MKKKCFCLLLSVIMLSCVLLFTGDVRAIDGSISVTTDKSTYNVGDPITVTITVNYSEASSLQGQVSTSGGIALSGNPVLYNESSDGGTWTAVYSGTITGEGDQSITATVNIASKVDVNPDTLEVANTDRSGSAGFHVITQAEIQASKAAEESRIAAEKAAEESRIAAEKAAEESRIAEESRQASIAASIAESEAAAKASRDEETRAEAERQASIDASIAAEQSSIAASRAAEESSRNASIAESVSIEESLRLESLSIQESIEESEAEESRALAESEAEESRSIAEESRSIAESIRESESLDDLTRAFEVGQDYFVPWDFEAESGRFLFAVADTALEAPEGFEKTDLLINRQYVFAAQNEKTAARTYLVFGSYDEDTEPEFYYFDMDTGRLFPYDSLNSMTDNRPQRIESTEESSEETDSEVGSVSGPEAEKHGFSILPAILFAAAGAIIGAGILGLILLIVRLARNKKESPAEGVPEPALSDADLPREPETVEMEEIPLEDNLVSDPDETMKVLFGETEPETLPLTEEEADSELPILEQESSDLHGAQAEEKAPEAAESAPAESAFDKAFAGAAAAAATKASPSGGNDSSFEIDEEEILTEDPVLSEELILPEDPEFSEDGNPADEADSLESEDLAAESPEDVDVEDEIIGEEE